MLLKRYISVLVFLVWPAANAAGYKCPSIDQGWDCNRVREFWFIDQGSKLMPYEWLMHLERADRRELFKDSLETYGFIEDPHPEADDLNPDKLPIGWANHKNDHRDKNDWVGITCAGCHTTRIDYEQERHYIEGAPNLVDFDSFVDDLVQALRATLDNREGRLEQFTAALTTRGGASEDVVAQLKSRTEYLERRQRISASPNKGGYGRVDAFGQIFNQLLVMLMGNPDSTAVPASAPVSFPFLWDIAQHDLVQWNGASPNLGLEGPGSVLRNIGEVLGVFGDVYDLSTPGSYESSVMVANLRTIESWIAKLRAPKFPWPTDAAAVARGKGLYVEAGCDGCHAVIDTPTYPIPITLTPVDEVQTDRQMIDNFMMRRGNTRMLEGRTVGVSRNPFAVFGPVDDARNMAAHLAAGALDWAERPGIVEKAKSYFKLLAVGDQTFDSYKARPLDGIWATAPFLHNGSVPNLHQLLLAPDERMEFFCVGSREFDRVGVGYSTQCGEQTFRFDTTQNANGNIGHAYGSDLSDEAKRDLIEYLKTL